MNPALLFFLATSKAWSILRGAKSGLVADWTRPADFVYATQPVVSGFEGDGWDGAGLGPYAHEDGETSTSLIELRCDDNKLTGYTPSVIPLTTTFIRMRRNLLPQTAVDQIIGDVHTNLSNRPSSGCQLFVEGNAAPSTAGKAKARDIRDHGWTVTHND